MSAIAGDVRHNAINTGNVTIEGPVANAKFSTNQYNNPVGLYSNQEVCNVLSQQSKHAGFANQVPIINRPKDDGSNKFKNSKTLAAINESGSRGHGTRQTRSMKLLGHAVVEE